MTTKKTYHVTLLSKGEIVPNLHYGINAKEWWIQALPNANNISPLYPLRIGMKTLVELKGYYFVTTIVKGNSIDSELPGYCCQCGSFTTTVEDSPTAAISNCYQEFFNVNTRFSGKKIIGFEDQKILKELLTDVSFQPLLILLDKISISIFKIGFSSNEEWHGAGNGYLSSFSYTYKKTNCNFIQKISNGLCHVEIWNNLNKMDSFVEDTPTAVWQHIGMLSKYTGDQLFGLTDSNIQKILSNNKTLMCVPSDWINLEIMEKLYNHYLKKKTISSIDWYDFFLTWLDRKGEVIELYTELLEIYPRGHRFSEHEIQAWHSMLRSTGCKNITPFPSKESHCKYNFICLFFKFIFIG
jgi:hypothetical protein